MKNYMRKFGVVLLNLFLICSLAACGSKEGSGDGKGNATLATEGDTKEYVYVAEWTTSPAGMEGFNSRDYTIRDDRIYFLTTQYAMNVNDKAHHHICYFEKGTYDKMAYLIEDFELPQMPEGYNMNIDKMLMGQDGSVYLFSSAAPSVDPAIYSQENFNFDEFFRKQQEQTKCYLTKLSMEGAELLNLEITDILKENGASSISDGVVAANGNLYLIIHSDGGAMSAVTLIIMDTEGKVIGQEPIPNTSYIQSIGCFGEGEIGILFDEKIHLVDEKGKVNTGELKNLPANIYNSKISRGLNGGILLNNDNALFEYYPDRQEQEKILSWIDLDVNADYIQDCFALPDGNIWINYFDWNSNTSSVVVLKKADAASVPVKESITLGCFNVGQRTKENVISFNRTNEKYRIVIKDYAENVDWSRPDAQQVYDDARKLFLNDIIAGNAPDIICPPYDMNPQILVEKGALEDLTPYLEASETYDREDFVESVLNAFRHNGVQYAIPANFQPQFVTVKKSLVGDKESWTIEDVMQILSENPGMALYSNAAQHEGTLRLLMSDYEQFVNWERGECDFESDDFKKILELYKSYPKEITEYVSDPIALREGKSLMYQSYMNDLQGFVVSKKIFGEGEEVRIMGFPTSSGSGVRVSATYVYTISSTSAHKEGAWEFIEYTLMDKNQSSMTNDGLPTKKSLLDIKIKNAQTSIQGGIWGWDGIEIRVDSFTGTDAKDLYALIDKIDGATYFDTEILNIIMEEAAPYLEGHKSVDEVCEIIQNRVSIYVNEQK